LPEKVADVKAKTPSKPPKAVPTPKVKNDPKPKRTPPSQPIVDDKQKETSPEALKRRTEYTTKLGPSPAIGPDSAVVKVFVISDFQCPVCRRAAEGTHELFDQFGEKVQWIFWQNPLDMHRKAMPTAKASMAAFKQSKFWEYHDVLFQNQRASNTEDILRYAVQLNLDGADFKKAMEEEALLKKIRSDQAAAELIGARGTPAFLINGKLQVGWGSAAGIGSMVTREQKAIEKLLSGGKSLKDALEERARANSKTPEDAEVFITHFLNGEPAERKVEEAK
jgi:protein-disulfide isomerase